MNNYHEVIDNYKKWYHDLQSPVHRENRRKDFLDYHGKQLTRVQIEPTQRCNFNCHMCPVNEVDSGSPDMSLSDFDMILGNLPDSVKYITLSGLGEPFLNPDYINMVRHASERGYITEIYNNGSMFDECVLPYVNELFFSMDAVDERLLMNLRNGVEKHVLIKNIESAVEYRKQHEHIRVNINFCISYKNQGEIPYLFELCQSLGVDSLHIQTVSNNFNFLSEKYLAFSEYVKKSHRVDWSKLIENYHDDYTFSLTIWYPRKLSGFCNWTFSSLYINKNLDVISCCHQVTRPVIFGNLKEQNVSGIYNSEKITAFRNAHRSGDDVELCRQCPY